ncbi:hypothetical protein BH23ACT8_BH23ACT8_00650 [soil metagenome]
MYLALAALGVVPDPLRRLSARVPHARVLFLGALVGAFLIGRPFPLFFRMFEYAAVVGNPAYGALTFVLQSVGNVVLMTVLFVMVFVAAGQRLQRSLISVPGRPAAVTAAALMTAGSFTFVYWVLRVPTMFGYGWFPTMPSNA